jgi:hypothetical protein
MYHEVRYREQDARKYGLYAYELGVSRLGLGPHASVSLKSVAVLAHKLLCVFFLLLAMSDYPGSSSIKSHFSPLYYFPHPQNLLCSFRNTKPNCACCWLLVMVIKGGGICIMVCFVRNFFLYRGVLDGVFGR